MGKTDFLEHEVLKMSTGQTLALALPITPHIALFTAAPSDLGGGTEVTGGAYARVNAAGLFGAPSGGQVANSAVIAFPNATATWGTVTHFAVLTAATGGDMLRWGALQTSRLISTGDPVSFAIGQLVMTEE